VRVKSNALSMRSLRLFRRIATTTNIKATTRTKAPVEEKTAIIAVLLWKKDAVPVDEDEDWDGDRA